MDEPVRGDPVSLAPGPPGPVRAEEVPLAPPIGQPVLPGNAPAGPVRAAHMNVELVCCTPERVWRLPLQLPAGATVQQALACVPPDWPGVCVDFGIHGLRVTASRPLQEGDRIELYRALLQDPKSARRARAERRRAEQLSARRAPATPPR